MGLWVCTKGGISAAFLIPNKIPEGNQLVGFNLSLHMGYINITTYFCETIETVSNVSNESIYDSHMAAPHPLKIFSAT